MDTKVYLAIRSRKDFYFAIRIPGLKNYIPTPSEDYKQVPLDKMISGIIKNYPGTVRDVSSVVRINPQLLVMLANGENHLTFIDRNPDHNCICSLIDLYYRHVMSRSPSAN